MRKTPITLAMLATLATFTPVVHADVTYTFSNLSLEGFEFVQMFGPGVTLLTGTLSSVSVNATLNASVDYTYADDLTIYVDTLPLSENGLLQVGGFSDLGASESRSWANGGSSAPGTTVIDSVALFTPISFSGASQPAVWLGNGYGSPTTLGTWTGSVTLRGVNTAVAAVPEPSTFAMMALGGLGLAGWASRRRKKAAAEANA